MLIVYYPYEDKHITYSTLKFYVEGSAVKLHVGSSDSPDSVQHPQYFLILVQAPIRGAWPSDVEVYTDGTEIQRKILESST